MHLIFLIKSDLQFLKSNPTNYSTQIFDIDGNSLRHTFPESFYINYSHCIHCMNESQMRIDFPLNQTLTLNTLRE